MIAKTFEMRYQQALQNMPSSGGGGCHVHLLRMANYGVIAGYSDAEILAAIRMRLMAQAALGESPLERSMKQSVRHARTGH